MSGEFGPQGGDPSRRVTMDLSTCVNRYGPPPAAIEALHLVKPRDIVMHPYDAPDRLRTLYEWAIGVDGDDLVTGRGATEFIWAMSRNVDHAGVAIPTPGYTDYMKAFPGRGFTIDDGRIPSLEQLDAAMATARLVVISNPHNPTAVHLERRGVLEVAGRHQSCTLVVDGSYVNFTPDPEAASVVLCDEPNVLVLRSTSKFYGIAATRAGIAWCRDRDRLRSLVGQQETWGLSGLDVRVAEASVRSWDWANDVRARMLDDSRWLADALTEAPGLDLLRNEHVHFQYAWTDQATRVADVFADHEIGVRSLGAAHGVHPGALRIVAPRPDERVSFAAALDAAAAEFGRS